MENNVPELIKQNKFKYFYQTIKDREETIEKLFDTQSKSNTIADPYINLWEIDKELFPNLREIKLENNGITFTASEPNVIITGSYIRSHLIKTDNFNIMNDVSIYKISDVKWKDLIDLSQFENTEDKYILKTEDKTIILGKKKYRSPAHVLIQGKYNTRIGLINSKLYCSSMFLVDYFSFKNDDLYDPVFHYPYDPLEIYEFPKKSKNTIQKSIELVDSVKLLKINKNNYDNLYDKKTIIELCMDKLNIEKHPILQNHLKQIIIQLSNYQYRRPPFLYAKYINLDRNLCKLLMNIDNKYEIQNKDKQINSLDDINLVIIEHCVAIDNYDYLQDFIKYINFDNNKLIVDFIIQYKSINILRKYITENILDQYLTYLSIFKTQELELFKIIEPKFSLDVGINFLRDIIQNNLVRSFYFLYKMDSNILTTKFDKNNNILHELRQGNNLDKMVKLIMNEKNNLINDVNDDNQTPIIYHAINNYEVLDILLNYDFDSSIIDNNGNTFLHYLSKIDNSNLIKKGITKHREIINIPNKQFETPILISCKEGIENNFYIFKYANALLDTKDIFGNTVYHYICHNNMCLGINVPVIKNNFGFVPTDYCKISSKYYN
jgi:hypothetical protein